MLFKTLAVAITSLVMAAAPAAATSAEPVQHEHTVTTVPAEGMFHCGDLVLSINGGTETEIFDGVLKHGVARVRIIRLWHGVTLAGSDGRHYRASGRAHARFVLVAPDFDNPVSGHEVINVRFHVRRHGSPGYLHEELIINDGVETDVVSGPCDYAD